MVDIESKLSRIKQSLYYFLLNETYQKNGGVAQKLNEHYPGLKIIPAYPTDLEHIGLPTIALTGGNQGEGNDTTFYPVETERIYPFFLYGFGGGESTPELNEFQRDEIRNDLHLLFEETLEIPFYTNPPTNTITDGAFETIEVSSRPLEPVSYLDAERFKFVVDFSVKLIDIEEVT